ncbi:PREDICTED: phospholipase A2-like [Nicrophorus vespilloides]|uniref:phospholipase A2 n=1 Tax=Nicrophorus vespilloides TaxID=110193 RepID=A0ABM1MY73_NICVS|nr:PREDICTED: phospholipase A2-like [Nicrophorus vespilloides]
MLFLGSFCVLLMSSGFADSTDYIDNGDEILLQPRFFLPATVHKAIQDSLFREPNSPVDATRTSFIEKSVNFVKEGARRIGKNIPFIRDIDTSGLDTNTSFFSGALGPFKKHVSAIFPGTRWCGDGNKAKGFDDLGVFAKTDKCCREHDNCPEGIESKSTKYGLKNDGVFTRSHCDCDTAFYNCLREGYSLVSKEIGFTYFNILGPQCFKKGPLRGGCIRYNKGKCTEYKILDENSTAYQWYDNQLF